MKGPRKNRLRDNATCWFIVEALQSALASRALSKGEQRDFIKQRLAQEHRVDPEEIASGRNRTLYTTLTRIYYVANPRTEKSRVETVEARRSGMHFLTCYAIAIGKKTLFDIDAEGQKSGDRRSVRSLDDIESRFRDVLSLSFRSGFFTEEILRAFRSALQEFESGGDLVRTLQSQARS